LDTPSYSSHSPLRLLPLSLNSSKRKIWPQDAQSEAECWVASAESITA